MDKHQFDQAIGEVPPSTVDVDGVVARERRAAWVRRVASPPTSRTSSAAPPAGKPPPCAHLRRPRPRRPRNPPGAQLLPKPATRNPPRPEYPALRFVHEYSKLMETSDGGCRGGTDAFMELASVVTGGQRGSIDAIVERLGGGGLMTGCPGGNVLTPGMTHSCDTRSRAGHRRLPLPRSPTSS